MYDLYVKAVSFSAGCASTAMMLTPLLICKDIVQKKTSDHVMLSTFVGALFRSSLFCRQGYMLNLPTVIFVHGMGLFVNSLYLALYYYYSNKKKEVMITIFKATLLSTSLLLYSFLESADVAATRFPIMVSGIHLCFVGWPLFYIKETFRTKQWSGHPRPILINTIVLCILWILYSINIQSKIIFTQCSVALILCSTQLGLSIKYPKTADKLQSHKVEKHE